MEFRCWAINAGVPSFLSYGIRGRSYSNFLASTVDTIAGAALQICCYKHKAHPNAKMQPLSCDFKKVTTPRESRQSVENHEKLEPKSTVHYIDPKYGPQVGNHPKQIENNPAGAHTSDPYPARPSSSQLGYNRMQRIRLLEPESSTVEHTDPPLRVQGSNYEVSSPSHNCDL